MHAQHRPTYSLRGRSEWTVTCTCGYTHWARWKFQAQGHFRDHVRKVYKQARRKTVAA